MRKYTITGIIIASMMIGMGIYREEVSMVLNKGINICLECIGIG